MMLGGINLKSELMPIVSVPVKPNQMPFQEIIKTESTPMSLPN